jgi:hypothetical protein
MTEWGGEDIKKDKKKKGHTERGVMYYNEEFRVRR